MSHQHVESGHPPRLLATMTSDEVKRAVEMNATALFPVGAVEQHGEYLPLGADTMASFAVASEASSRGNAVVVPPLWYGFSPHHMWRSGTISLKPETIAAVIVDVCASLAAHGFREIILLNGHRQANLPPLQLGAFNAASAISPARVVLVDLQDLADARARELDMLPFGHGDECETAHLLHLHPELVRVDKMPPPTIRPQATDKGVGVDESLPPTVWFGLRRPDGPATSGHPDRATAANGASVHEAMVTKLLALIA
jgi:creatinine amidohydrolase